MKSRAFITLLGTAVAWPLGHGRPKLILQKGQKNLNIYASTRLAGNPDLDNNPD